MIRAHNFARRFQEVKQEYFDSLEFIHNNECVVNGYYTNLVEKRIQNLTGKKHAIFVNNMRLEFESAKQLQLNAISVKKVNELFSTVTFLKQLKANYVCFPYIEEPGDYTDPCDYIEIIKNQAYETVINTYYRVTKRLDFPKTEIK